MILGVQGPGEDVTRSPQPQGARSVFYARKLGLAELNVVVDLGSLLRLL